jgi:hypothetical protein
MTTTYQVKNLISGKIVRDACSRSIITFETKEDAERYAFSLTRFAVVSEKRANFVVIPA